MTTSEKYDGRLLADASLWRDSKVMRSLLERIKATTTRPWNIMEVCGGQTFTLSRYRFEELLPSEIKMVHGPGCPVCVTPAETIDAAIELALRPDVILCSFGDMMRVPGNRGSLLRAKAEGADIRLLYSPLDALKIAVANPGKQVVFFAIGFETTAPLYAMLAEKAAKSHIPNFSRTGPDSSPCNSASPGSPLATTGSSSTGFLPLLRSGARQATATRSALLAPQVERKALHFQAFRQPELTGSCCLIA